MARRDDAEDGIVVRSEEDGPTGGDTEERALDPLTTITPRQDGPFVVEGTISLVGPDGTAVEHTGRTFLCRCGGSADKPLCDGSHKRNGFTAPGVPVRRKPDRP